MRRGLHLAINGGLRVIAVALVAGALAVPAFAYWTATRPPVYGLASQVSVPLGAGNAGVKVPGYSGRVLILCYHDLADVSHNRYTVTPEAFAAQMAALHAQGFHAISQRTFLRFVAGDPVQLPARPVLITFDDGAKGVWIYADPVLRRLHYQATSFIITGDVSHHQPYYLDWKEVEAMQRSGRWSFGSHTSNGHGRILIDSSGSTNPFLTNREWLPAQNRLETLDEYRHRVTSDLDQSVTDMTSHGLPRPRMFAYPFSAFRTPTNDPAVPAILTSILAKLFAVRMDNVSVPEAISRGMQSPLPRVEVYRTTTVDALLSELSTTIDQGRTKT